MPRPSVEQAWNALADTYQGMVEISLDQVHYGPCSLGEDALKLLGDVRGRAVIELGCGGGQNTIALGRAGAEATGVDLSAEQLRLARRVAEAHEAPVRFLRCDLRDLTDLPAAGWDTALSCFAAEYLEDADRFFAGVHRLLKPGGRFVYCDLHPFVSGAEVVAATMERITGTVDYFGAAAMPFDWPRPDGSATPLTRHHRTVGDLVNGLIRAGLRITAIQEPPLLPAAGIDGAPYLDETIEQQREVWSRLPYTLIVVCEKA